MALAFPDLKPTGSAGTVAVIASEGEGTALTDTYEAPRLAVLGAVEALTAGAQGAESDGDGSVSEKLDSTTP